MITVCTIRGNIQVVEMDKIVFYLSQQFVGGLETIRVIILIVPVSKTKLVLVVEDIYTASPTGYFNGNI